MGKKQYPPTVPTKQCLALPEINANFRKTNFMGVRKLMEERIQELMDVMRDEELAEVLSLMESTRAKKKEEYMKNLNEIVGKYKDVLSSTEDFMKRKQEEKKLDC